MMYSGQVWHTKMTTKSIHVDLHCIMNRQKAVNSLILLWSWWSHQKKDCNKCWYKQNILSPSGKIIIYFLCPISGELKGWVYNVYSELHPWKMCTLRWEYYYLIFVDFCHLIHNYSVNTEHNPLSHTHCGQDKPYHSANVHIKYEANY